MSNKRLLWILVFLIFNLFLLSSISFASQITYAGTNRMVLSTVPDKLIPGYSVCSLSNMSCYGVLLFPIDSHDAKYINLFLDINHDIESGNPQSLELCVLDSSKLSQITYSQVQDNIDCSHSQIIILNDGSSSVQLNNYNKNFNTFILKPRQSEFSLKITHSRLHGTKQDLVLNCIDTGNVCCDECSDSSSTISNSGCIGSKVCCSSCKLNNKNFSNYVFNNSNSNNVDNDNNFEDNYSINIISGTVKNFTTCNIISLTTNKLSYHVGDLITISLQTSNCNNSLIDLNIYSKTLFSSKLVSNKHIIISNNSINFTWFPSNKPVLGSNSKYYVLASSKNALKSNTFILDYSYYNKSNILNSSFYNSLKKIESISFSNPKVALDLCSSFNDMKYDDCIKSLAKANNDPRYCSYIKSSFTKDQCNLFFINLGYTSLCSELSKNNILCYTMSSAQSNTKIYNLTNKNHLTLQNLRHPDSSIRSQLIKEKKLITWKNILLMTIMFIVFCVYIFIVLKGDKLNTKFSGGKKRV